MNELSERENSLYGEMTDVQYEIMYKVNALIGAKWDSPTLKAELEELNTQAFKLQDEIDLLEKKEKEKDD